MTALESVNPVELLRQQLAEGSPDVLAAMVTAVAKAMMSAEADAVCGAAYGQRSDERVNSRNGYRPRAWDTRAGTVELAIPKLRQGTYFPDWLLEHRRRAEQALVTVVATSYLLGVSTRRVEKLAEQLGVAKLSKSQVSQMAQHLHEQVNADGHREVLGLEVCASEDGAGWVAFLRGLTARGLKGVKLVISDAHRGLLDAIGTALPVRPGSGAGPTTCVTC